MLLSLNEFAKHTINVLTGKKGVSRSVISRLIRKKKKPLPAQKIGNFWTIDEKYLKLTNHRKNGKPKKIKGA